MTQRIRELVLISGRGEMVCHVPIRSSDSGGDPLVEARQELFTVLMEQTGMRVLEVNRVIKGVAE